MPYAIEDLLLAYRKAKVDIYYSSNAPLLDIAAYEESLENRLENLAAKLADADESWCATSEFLGDWTLAPKSLDMTSTDDPATTVFAAPADRWKQLTKLRESHQEAHAIPYASRPKAELRLMADCSMDFHVVSTLWMMKVGSKYDERLSDSSYGNRLRRDKNGEINPLSVGTFKQYLRPFRAWRDGGIRAMRGALSEGKKVAALTADVSSFYHELQPDFLLDKSFNELLGVSLDAAESKLHRIFVSALRQWGAKTPLKRGLPVGLPASALVANTALIEFDRIIEKEVVPLYYGRYVDDIILVLENGGSLTSTSSLWSWLFERFNGRLGWVGDATRAVQFTPAYLQSSRIVFESNKNKAFILQGATGETFLDSLVHHINKRASEWRALPNLPTSAKHVGTDLIAATQRDGEVADNLRKTDSVAMRRAGFAIKLRDFEAYERDLEPSAWVAHRHAFFDAFISHVLVLPEFFDLAIYMPRVVRLATACADFSHLKRIINGVLKVCNEVEVHCETVIKSCSPDSHPPKYEMDFFLKRYLLRQVSDAVIASFPTVTSEQRAAWVADVDALWRELRELIGDDAGSYDTIASIRMGHRTLFVHDLAHMPFRFVGLSKQLISQRGLRRGALEGLDEDRIALSLPAPLLVGAKTLAKWIGKGSKLPSAFVFPTRPFQIPELYLLVSDPFDPARQAQLRNIVLAIRGFSLGDDLPRFQGRALHVSDAGERSKPVVSVSSWRTDIASWTASVMQMMDPDIGRYGRLTHLINSVMSSFADTRYLVLPELAMPAHWFLRFSQKLQARGISLITGIQYLHTGHRVVHNQVWAGLTNNSLGFPSLLVYRQDKQRPALREEQELFAHAGLRVEPSRPWKLPPIIDHAGFRFSLLVCSELTNIKYRASLRGRVDAVFVPEWNQDTETFHSLVESAAQDVHAFVVQCNDREYGDSRIRSPYKDSWRRDVLRVKGGLDDYFVSGVIDVAGLRAFQSTHRSGSKPFKPVPDGFVLDPARRVLPGSS
ncbi:Reverse transcriptase (RNA-dependent DNA polymerase) [Luteibacter sp. UNCMF331Sha3.1]|uniref:RNA-directed DNA polymerase n=1 Tax=Luteibacter sp. UNCMF331Sha3.1 TaxID=1502760 RepID=UPI0008CB3603|nr:RNA-directed DNA polymerase [Luteibacter sp. UNCMF331Sha3.1]SEM89659.1 Reverse transcriptase (RNA-dependent DNA polymerase) [Luteibacter sp. UNCMF331Sha3.1]